MEQSIIPNDDDHLKGDDEYYRTLKHYRPLCYSGKGIPFFLINDTYYQSLPCIICLNAVFLIAIAISLITAQNTNKTQMQIIFVKLYLLVLALLDISYFLTIAMNPGIISENHMTIYKESDVRSCKVCMRKKVDMSHCYECEVCVQDLDHHCGFFGRCIAGKQRFAFYTFLLFMFVGFVLLLVGLTSNLN